MNTVFPQTPEPEIWKPVPSYPGYEASSLGRIRSYRLPNGGRSPTPHLLHPRKDKHRYLHFQAGSGNFLPVHHAVLLAFVGPRPGNAAGLHRNDIPDDNRPENLYWGSQVDNWADHKRNGYAFGSQHWNSKLTEEQVAQIKRLRRSGWGWRSIQKQFPFVSQYTIRDIIRGKVWTHVE